MGTQPLELHPLFPCVVLKTNIGRDITDAEINSIDEVDVKDNHGNLISVDENVLHDLESLSNLKKEAESVVDSYLREVIKPINSLDVYITTSWINKTPPGNYHHKHRHPNSYLSGVIILKSDPNYDDLTYHRGGHIAIQMDRSEHNKLNSDSWSLPVSPGDIFLFPSDIQHEVQRTKPKGDRLSIAFNTWVKGSLGNSDNKTRLNI